MELRARLLLLRVGVASEKVGREEAVAALERLAEERDERADRATVLYELTRLNPTRPEEREAAAASYRDLCLSTPQAE